MQETHLATETWGLKWRLFEHTEERRFVTERAARKAGMGAAQDRGNSLQAVQAAAERLRCSPWDEEGTWF